ncbi:ABC-F family ATP-binding cassette domain-containing protein [Mobiluncus curtisii]|uniref:ABC-F family ATP-binding cassette domain-containing protein n=1 Tax=Mobiluncus curtisii TaxID=2051 RepID=UPI00147040E2|nr:ABC-F family ATP-binding cassette domain-containing protein [Mobiluncus curtisii]NMW44537.1 ABC-F family ATP-binding cassette domain-containing protein [Mobiluncus curtisii]NMW83392.1 ABC-F family ATP-binding cassette domain-containing protein [Mobiluncus curtisii]NMW98392.1 ABC-F family ATP-binding cassette domain-containing protein [Mobiluncus curtisii]NMX05119.1 ABC-F family ATP-binding cassette domain-containing protein [Mobiluncus curtisii]
MGNLLGGQNLHVEYPDKLLLDDVTVGVSAGDRIGIVGRNGDGKSTLLRVLFGAQQPHSGLVTRRNGLRVALLGQEDVLSGSDTVETVLLAGSKHHEVLSDPRIREVLDGLLPAIAWESPVEALSGGQRRRLALAKLLIGDWDVIGLDEPTNHLDMEGVAWLAHHLNRRWATREGALLLVTHDRWFLDAVSRDTWEVHDGRVEPFEGGYAAYILARVERDRQAALAAEKRQNLLRKELAWLRRGAPARTSKPKFRIDAANALIEDVPPVRDTVQLVKLATGRLGKIVVDLVDVDFSYDGSDDSHPVLRDVTWRVAPGERAGILGANGAGKSTLLGLLAGELTPTRGRRREGKTVQIGILDQEFRALREIAEYRVYQVLGKLKGSFEVEGKELSPAQMLERLGFNSSQLQAKVGALSGGQKRRLQILLLLLEEPNVMILDEPTNDIDTDTLTALEDLLDAWSGTLLVVSHDRYLIERITDNQYAVIDHGLRHLPGGVDEYLELAAQARQASRPKSDEPLTSQTPLVNGKTSSKADYETQKRLQSVERKIAKATAQVAQIESQLAATDPADYEKLADLAKELHAARDQLERLEEQWMEAAEEL